MRSTALLLAATVALIVPPAALTLSGYKEGPLPAMTGGFGEKTCHTCHFDNPMNDHAGSVRVEGLPPSYTPGREYALTVVVRRTEIKRAGFELAVRFTDGAQKGHQAGTLRTSDERTQLISAPGDPVVYIQHTKVGSSLVGPNEGRWTVSWTAPAQPTGRIIVHVAGNAANDDASPLGDHIYTTSLTSRAAAGR